MKLNFFSSLLILLVAGATLIGAWFYAGQLAATPIYLWFFVPDCPLYAMLGAPILLFGFPKNAALRFVISCGLAIYGSWTIFVLMLYAGSYFNAANLPVSLVLLAGHIGMILEALLVLPKKEELKIGALLLAIGWFMLNLNFDYFDGALSTYPWIPKGKLDVVIMFTAFASLAWPVVLFALAGFAEKNKLIVFLRKELSVLE